MSAENWGGISKITHFKIHSTFNRNSGAAGFRGLCLFWISIENPMYFEMSDFRNSTSVLRTHLDRSRREINFIPNRWKLTWSATCFRLLWNFKAIEQLQSDLKNAAADVKNWTKWSKPCHASLNWIMCQILRSTGRICWILSFILKIPTFELISENRFRDL